MLKELIEFVDSVLPAVPLDTKKGLQEAIAQFDKEGEQINFLMKNLLGELSQGDILSEIPFIYFDDDGNQIMFKAKAMVLSTSCHIDNKDKMVLVPIIPIDEFEGNIIELKKNKVVDFMYIPDGKMADMFIDFEIMNTFSKKMICEGIKKGIIRRLASLSQIGYYLLIIKLTIYLMRREDTDTLSERALELDGF